MEDHDVEAVDAEEKGTLEVKESKVPKILLEILVYGVSEDKKKIKKMMDTIEIQMGKNRKANGRVRVLWYIDQGEFSDEEKIEWLKENTRSKYHIFAPAKPYKVPNDFVRRCLEKIRDLEKSLENMSRFGIERTGLNKAAIDAKKDEIEEAEIVEESNEKSE